MSKHGCSSHFEEELHRQWLVFWCVLLNKRDTRRIALFVVQDNRDARVLLLQKYAARFFPSTKYLDYAVQVEEYTLQKAANLVLNVDGCIGTLFLDLLHSSSQFTEVGKRVDHAAAVACRARLSVVFCSGLC